MACQDTKEELGIVSTMLEKAMKFNLEPEVVWSFYHAMKENPKLTLEEAAFVALGDWDIIEFED